MIYVYKFSYNLGALGMLISIDSSAYFVQFYPHYLLQQVL